jgi:hypothetical protein
MGFSTYSINCFSYIVKFQYGRLPLIYISLFSFSSGLNELRRTLFVIICTTLLSTRLPVFSNKIKGKYLLTKSRVEPTNY